MFETFDKIMLAGLGALSMTREKAEKIFDEYVGRGQVEKEKRSGFIKEMVDSAEKTRNELEKLVSEQVNKAAEQLNIPTREDLKRIEEKLDQLLKKG
jgi:poly(hydroxyalkanoate) granule-associated protein